MTALPPETERLLQALKTEKPAPEDWFDEAIRTQLYTVKQAYPSEWGILKAYARQQGIDVFLWEREVDRTAPPLHARNGTVAPPSPVPADWDTLDVPARLEAIRSSKQARVWFSDAALDTLGTVRHTPAIWGHFKAEAWKVHIAAKDLEAAVDARLKTHRALEQADDDSRGRRQSILERSYDDVLVLLRDEWHLDVTEVIRHGTEGALWHLRLRTGQDVALGTSSDLLSNPRKIRNAIFDQTGIQIPRYGPKDLDQWDEIVGTLAGIARTVDTPELTRLGLITQVLREYCDREKCQLDRDVPEEDWERVALNNKPFVRSGGLHIHAKSLWLDLVHGSPQEVPYPHFLDLLRLVGAVRLTVMLNAYNTSRSLWKCPVDRLREHVGGHGEPHDTLDPHANTGAFNAFNQI